MLAGQDQLHVVLVWMTAVSGAVVGSLMLYVLGRRAGEPFVRSLVRRYGRWLQMSERQLDDAFALYNRYGASFVLIGRSIPVLRSVVSLTAGVTGMRLPLFVAYSALNSLLITGFWIFVGYLLGENWREVLAVIGRFEPLLTPIAIIAAVVVVLVFVYRRLRSRQRVRLAIQPHEVGD
jgi:membrane protein DedA with SNARE-associated domain